MKHLALAVSDQERSRRFYETYFGFGARPARRYDDGVLMLYNADGFSLALGPTDEPIEDGLASVQEATGAVQTAHQEMADGLGCNLEQ